VEADRDKGTRRNYVMTGIIAWTAALAAPVMNWKSECGSAPLNKVSGAIRFSRGIYENFLLWPREFSLI
jgi:hypothetical protein